MASEARNRVLDTLLSSVNSATMSREERIQALLASAAAALPPADAGRSVGALLHPYGAAQAHHHHHRDDLAGGGSVERHDDLRRGGRYTESTLEVATFVSTPPGPPLSPQRPSAAPPKRLSSSIQSPGAAPARVSASSVTELLSSGGNLSDRALKQASQQQAALVQQRGELDKHREQARLEVEAERHAVAVERASLQRSLVVLQDEQRTLAEFRADVERERASLAEARAAVATERSVLEATHAQLAALSASSQVAVEEAQRLRASHETEMSELASQRAKIDALLIQAQRELRSVHDAAAVAARERQALDAAAAAAEAKISAAQRAADDVMRLREMVAASATHLAGAWREFEAAQQEAGPRHSGARLSFDDGHGGGSRKPRTSASQAAARLSEALHRVSVPDSVSLPALPAPVNSSTGMQQLQQQLQQSSDAGRRSVRTSLARLEADRGDRLQALRDQAAALTSALSQAQGVVAPMYGGDAHAAVLPGGASPSGDALAAAAAAAAQARQHASFVRRLSETAAADMERIGARRSTGGQQGTMHL